jgi:hypothetical protein
MYDQQVFEPEAVIGHFFLQMTFECNKAQLLSTFLRQYGSCVLTPIVG